MGQAKQEGIAHEEMLTRIEALGIEEKALFTDKDTDEVSSAEDEDANKSFYARAFKEWAEGKLHGEAQDIFDAVTEAIGA